MKRVALLVSLLVVLLSFGCGKQEKTEEKTAPEAATVEAPEKATEEHSEKAMGILEKATQKAEQLAHSVAEKTGEVAAQVEQKTTEIAETTTQAVEEKAVKATEVVESAVETGKEAATEAVTTATEKATAVVEAVAPAKVAEGSLIIASSYGNVTFSHKTHSESFDCAICHGEGEPGALEMGKEKAHAVCKGCHIEKAAGPTKCSECHVK